MNKELPLVLWILLFLAPCLMQAQGSANVSQCDSLIKVNFVGKGRYTQEVFTRNGEVLTNTTMKSLLHTYPGSAEELGIYQRQRTAVPILLSISAVSLIAGVIQGSNQKNATGNGFSKAPVFFSISIGTMISPIIIGVGNNHLHKAIAAYNRRL